MRQIILLILCVSLLGSIVSCRNQPSNTTENSSEKHDKEEGLQTNNGEPWEANAETTEGIKKMEAIVFSFSEPDSINAYANLKSELEVEFKIIFEKCTMTGEAHDQLHNYLFPLKRYFNRLVAEDAEIREKALTDLKEHLSTYPKYFK